MLTVFLFGFGCSNKQQIIAKQKAGDAMIKRSGINAKQISDEKVDYYGMILAKWCNVHHLLMKINGKPITDFFPATAGYGHIYYELLDGATKAGTTVNPEIRQNLKSVIINSNCDLEKLNNYLISLKGEWVPKNQFYDDEKENWHNALKKISPVELKKELSCLGEIEFEELSFSPE